MSQNNKVTHNFSRPVIAIRPKERDAEQMFFSDGTCIEVVHHHDCCEHNYADWTSLDDTGFWNTYFRSLTLENWEGGFRINGYAVNCYSEQNGYYTNEIQVYYRFGEGYIIGIEGIECEGVYD